MEETILFRRLPPVSQLENRAYQRVSAELQKRKKARQLAKIGFASQERKRMKEARAQAEESRKAEKHAVHIAVANLRKQREEMKLGDALAKMLPPPDFDLSSLDRVFSAAATLAVLNREVFSNPGMGPKTRLHSSGSSVQISG